MPHYDTSDNRPIGSRVMHRLVAIAVAVLLIAGSVTVPTAAQADNSLVQKLVNLFKGRTPAQIDNAVTQAKKQLTHNDRRNDLEKLFDSQIATLRDRDVPEQILTILKNQKSDVLKKASEITTGENNISFLPVIPQTFRSSYDLMSMVRNGDKAGYTYLIPMQISDVVDAPQWPYYIYDVDDGNATTEKSLWYAEKDFESENRSPLTVAEVIALYIHTNVSPEQAVSAAGSRYESNDRIPIIQNDKNDLPELTWMYFNSWRHHWSSRLR